MIILAILELLSTPLGEGDGKSDWTLVTEMAGAELWADATGGE